MGRVEPFDKKNIESFNIVLDKNTPVVSGSFDENIEEHFHETKTSLVFNRGVLYKDEPEIPFSDFKRKGFLITEQWEKTEIISGKIISFDRNSVCCDCILDKENKVFETREFPIKLFQNIKEISENIPVIIKIKIKKGSIRFDVIDGNGIVDLELFSLKERWEKLRNSGLDEEIEVNL